ncbi:MAG: hypothetical protein K2M76_05915, partial [Muribaculaceae bacterium]|nr:hypothetical protein [Muribaculaceae bacterium]
MSIICGMRGIVYVVIASVLLCCAVTGCSDRRASEVLPRAAAVMDYVPDSALVWLEQLDGSRLHGEQRADYALLLTQARYKCYVPQTSDSLISIAVDYYDRGDEYGDRLVKALYYKAEILNEAGDRTHSLLTAMQAEKVPCFGRNPEFAARVYDLMAELYRLSYMFDLDLEYTKRAADMYSLTDLRKNYLYTLIDIAIVKSDLKDYAGSIALLDSVMPLCLDYGNNAVIGACLSAYTRPLRYTRQYERMDSVCHEMFKLIGAGEYRPK